jgi:alkanesulfonate monooxygenase SsuD/methylene tetrahydromethanopterin reductase-like flavin-dependent oxidoreductase (luciferase family)
LSINEVVECSKILSKHNPDSIWIRETWGMDCSSMLSTIAQITKKSKIGSSIINIYSRTPSLIAMNAATIDTLSGGRLILGLGSSSQAIVEQWHGIEFTQPLQRMQEYVEIIRQITSGKKVTYNGKFFNLRNFSLLIKPFRTEIPIYLAAINQKMIELTWQIGDGVIFYLRPVSEMKETIVKMQNKRKIDVACQIITCVSNDAEEAIIRAKKTIAFYASVGKIYREFLAKNGYEKEIREIVYEYTKSGLANNYGLVSDSMVNSLTICGTPDELPVKLQHFIRSGVDLPILQFNPIGNVTESFKLLVSSLVLGDTP